jgi:adenylate cyclase
MGAVHRNNYIIIGFSLFMIVLAILLSLVLSRLIARPMHQLSAEMQRIEKLDLGVSEEIPTILTEIDTMQGSFDGMKTSQQNFRRYVPVDLVSQLVGQKQEATLGGVCRQLTILFSDIANFTSISEHLEPEVLVQDLCEYCNVISRVILTQRGPLDKYIGDSVMAFWGAPVELDSHAYHACLSTVTAQDRLALCPVNGRARARCASPRASVSTLTRWSSATWAMRNGSTTRSSATASISPAASRV